MLTFNDLLRLLFGDNRKRLSRESLWNQVCAYLTPCRQERIRNLFLFFCSSGKDNLSAIECVSFLTFLFWMESIAFITGRYASPLSLFPSLTRSINYKPVALECTSKLFADFHLRNGFRLLPKDTFLEKILGQPLSVPFVTSTPFFPQPFCLQPRI